MKQKLRKALALLLVMMCFAAASAEGITWQEEIPEPGEAAVSNEALDVGEVVVEQQVELSAGEIDVTLGGANDAEPGTETPTEPGTETPTEPGTETPTEPGTETPTEPGTETPTEPGTETPTEPGTETPTEPGTETPEEPATPAYFGDPLGEQTITVKKNCTRTVYMGLSYRIVAPNVELKKIKSSSAGIATVTADGALTPVSVGSCKITLTAVGGAKAVVTLKVKATPAPSDLKITGTVGAFKLAWKAAPLATGYLVEDSADKQTWNELAVLAADATTLDVTEPYESTRYFRVKAILGDAFGGKSGVVSVLSPVTGMKVVCEETYSYGPTDNLKLSWTASAGAVSYNVYHANQADGEFKLLGSTKKTFCYPTRTKKKLDYYKVEAVFSETCKVMTSKSVNLWTGYAANVLPPSSMKSDTGIILVVNKRAQIVTAYVKDSEGKYTVPLRHMICSSGRIYDRTENGTYTLKARSGEWKTYPNGVKIRYPSTYISGYYFHSPLYNPNGSLMTSTVGKLGTRQSLGCVRLKVNDAKWVYENCKAGTKVYICDGKTISSLKSKIRPKTVKIK